MRLIKLHRVLVVGGAALVASCSDSAGSQRQTVTNLDAAANDDGAQPSSDAAPQQDAQGVDAWLSWITANDAATTDAETPAEDAADAAPSDAGNATDAAPADSQGVDAWLSWALAVSQELQLSEHQRGVLAGVWAFRARAERDAIARFRRLSSELARQGAERRVVELATAAVDDEERHARLCSDLARHYGSRDTPGIGSAPAIGPRGAPPADQLLYEVVAFCCVTETLNTSLMHVAYTRARVPYVREAIREILRDEIWHSRLGWAHLHAARADGQGAFLSLALPRMLAGAVRMELFSDSTAKARTSSTCSPITASSRRRPGSRSSNLRRATCCFPGSKRWESTPTPREFGSRRLEPRAQQRFQQVLRIRLPPHRVHAQKPARRLARFGLPTRRDS